MKKVISSLLMVAVIWSSICVMPIFADSSDAAIQSKIDELWNMVGNTYFTKDHSTGCGKKSSGHGCSNCYTPNIVSASWFINLFGNISAYQFPHTYYNNGEQHGRPGYSCFGFASFAEWYIFKSSNSDTVDTYHAGTYKFNYSNIQTYAKKGDLIRLHNGDDGGHSVIFVGANSTGIQVLHSNWTGDYNCYVRQDTIKYSSTSYSYSYFTISRVNSRNVSNTEAPSNVTINVDGGDESNHYIGDIVPITYHADNADYYNMIMFKGQDIYYQDSSTTGYCAASFDSPGHYCCYIEAVNKGGTATSRWVGWNIYTKAEISTDKTLYCIGDKVTVNIGDDESIKRYVGVHKGEPFYTGAWVDSNTFEFIATEIGEYYVDMENFFETGTLLSDRYYFTIAQKSNICIDKGNNSTYTINESVNVNVTNSTSTYHYVGVHKYDELLGDYKFYCGDYVYDGNYIFTPSEVGSYKVNTEAHINGQLLGSDFVYFQVKSQDLESTVTKSGEKLIIDTKVHNIAAPYDILIVGYKENRLVTMKRVPHDEQNSPYTLEGDIDEIKVMVWDGLSTIKPLCEAEEIPSSKWITE